MSSLALGNRSQRRRRDQIEVVEESKWQDPPRDILTMIFKMLEPFEIMYRAQVMCYAWRRLAKQPEFFRTLRLYSSDWNLKGRKMGINLVKMYKEMVDRSCGQLVDLHLVICEPEVEEILHYAVDKPNSLKSLALFDVSTAGLVKVIKKVPNLGRLELIMEDEYFYNCPIPTQVLGEIGESCSQLKTFFWTSRDPRYDEQISVDKEYKDDEILAIAKFMPELCELHLECHTVTDAEMKALLDGCPNLELLDLEKCYKVDLSKKCMLECRRRIKSLKLK